MGRKKSRFYVGQCVSVKGYARFERRGDKRVMVIETWKGPDWVGWIVGCTWRFEGRRVDGNTRYYYGGDLDYTPPYLTDLKKVKLWKVLVKSMSQKPYEVPDEYIKESTSWEPLPYLPLKYSRPSSAHMRKLLSEGSKSWPRDAKGRWTKTNSEPWLIEEILVSSPKEAHNDRDNSAR